MERIDIDGRLLWSYLKLHQQVESADAIFAFGSDATRVANRAAELWHAGSAPYVIISGGNAHRSPAGRCEADIFADIVLARGVPREHLIIEREASNTEENIRFVRALLAKQGHSFASFILVQKPYMERRVFATFRKLWPEASCVVTSPQLAYEDYARDTSSRDRLMHHMVGALHRILVYPEKGFQIPQEMPEEVHAAYERLLAAGYTKSLPRDDRAKVPFRRGPTS